MRKSNITKKATPEYRKARKTRNKIATKSRRKNRRQGGDASMKLFPRNSKKHKQWEDKWDHDTETDVFKENLKAYTDRLYEDLQVENPYKIQSKRKVWDPM